MRSSSSTIPSHAFRPPRRAALCLSIVTACLIGTSASSARAAKITTRGRFVQRIGALDVSHGRNGMPSDALQVFGPARTRAETQRHCKLFWPALHLTLDYVNYGLQEGFGCNDTYLQYGYAGAPWRTGRGLHTGSTLAALEGMYPRARRQRGNWWALLPFWIPAGSYSPISAKVCHAHVTQLGFFIGLAAE